MIIEENIVFTLSLGTQLYHTECCTLNMFHKMQFIAAIYCLNLFSASTWPTTSYRFEPFDVYICNFFFLRITAVMLIWIKVEQGQHLRYHHNICCTHSATLGLKYMCYCGLCTVWECLWTFECLSKCFFISNADFTIRLICSNLQG